MNFKPSQSSNKSIMKLGVLIQKPKKCAKVIRYSYKYLYIYDRSVLFTMIKSLIAPHPPPSI